jgi:ATPase family protein associated with various cellular activities (AAA)
VRAHSDRKTDAYGLDMDDDELRSALGKLVRQLTRDEESGARSMTAALHAHLGSGDLDMPILTQELHSWELPNLQLALDAVLSQTGWSGQVLGLAGQARHYPGLGLADFMHESGWPPSVGSPEYVNAAVGPGQTMACLAFAVVLVTTPGEPIAALVRRSADHGPMGGTALTVQAAARTDGAAAAFLGELRRLMDVHDVFRGQVLTVKPDPLSGSEVVFLERPHLTRDDVVLPDGMLDTIERHVAGPSRHRETLLAAGRHLARGLLLWGPPGTGKTHMVRYLTGLLEDTTVVILSGPILGAVGGFTELARRLAPSLVVLEDVDLVAQERSYGPFGSSSVLFELLNQMDGISGDVDVAFVLTTNRADVLEPALAARPGRVDLAVERPLPDAAARRRLLDLYAVGLDLRLERPDEIVERMEGVTASFVREVLRKATLHAAEDNRTVVTDDDLGTVLDELLAQTAALTRVLLGGAAQSRSGDALPHPHAWLEGMQPEIDLG